MKGLRDFVVRTVTAFFLIIFAYGVIQFLPPPIFSIVLFLIISAVAFEFIRLTQPKTYSFILIFLVGLMIGASFTLGKPPLPAAIFGIVFITGLFFLVSLRDREKLPSFVKDMGIHFMVFFYIYIPLYFLLELKKLGPHFLYFLIIVIAIGDSGAYFVGRALGRRKIYPVASPNKTLEGIIAAVLTAAPAGWLSILLFPIDITPLTALLTGAVVGLLSQLSDPVESLFKRASDKKDSGSILPGHGGILDRLDSYIFCGPALFFIIQYFWKL